MDQKEPAEMEYYLNQRNKYTKYVRNRIVSSTHLHMCMCVKGFQSRTCENIWCENETHREKE